MLILSYRNQWYQISPHPLRKKGDVGGSGQINVQRADLGSFNCETMNGK